MSLFPMQTNKPGQPLLVAEAGVAYRPPNMIDPFFAWMDLMEAVEALCPEWPMRKADEGGVYKL